MDAAHADQDLVSPIGKRERTKARNRATIMRAARKVFATLGYEAATVRDIVRETDLAVGTFYQYFRDKSEVFAAVAEEALAELRARLRRFRTDRTRPFEERILAAYRAFFEFAAEERPLFEVLDRNLASLPDDPGKSNLVIALREVEEDLRPDLETRHTAPRERELIAAATIGVGLMVARRMLDRGELDPASAARFCTRFALGALAHSPGLDERGPKLDGLALSHDGSGPLGAEPGVGVERPVRGVDGRGTDRDGSESS